MKRWIALWLASFVVGACGAETPMGPMRACEPGRSISCVCASGQEGAQTCFLDGSRYGICACNVPPRDAGFPQDRGSTPPPDVMPAVDVASSPDVPTSDPCASATNCGACTPLAGCGWCGASNRCVHVNATCTGPESGACGAGWACQPTDCAGSTDCLGCMSNSDCLSGTCGRRLCDGARACIPMGRPASCLTVGGVACPRVPLYRQCTSDGDCGPRMRCITAWPGEAPRVCALPCAVHADCPAPTFGGGVGVAYCSSSDHACLFGCDRAGACDADLSCRRDATGAYQYCL